MGNPHPMQIRWAIKTKKKSPSAETDRDQNRIITGIVKSMQNCTLP